MSDFKRLKSEVFEGGRKELEAVIKAIRSIEATPVEREFDKAWGAELKDRVAKGRAVTFLWAVADLTANGHKVRLRINGQHSSWALGQLLQEGALPDNLAIHLDTYSVEDEAAAVHLFRQFDSRKSARSKEDIAGAYQCFQPTLRHCHRGVLKSSAEGVVWYRREIQKHPVESGDDVYALFNEAYLHPFFLMMDRILGNGKSNELKRIPVLGAAYGTWLTDAKMAEQFWAEVAQGDTRNEDDAPSELDAELLRIKADKERTSAAAFYLKCVKAWKAYEAGVRVANFRVDTRKGIPPMSDLAA